MKNSVDFYAAFFAVQNTLYIYTDLKELKGIKHPKEFRKQKITQISINPL